MNKDCLNKDSKAHFMKEGPAYPWLKALRILG